MRKGRSESSAWAIANAQLGNKKRQKHTRKRCNKKK
jgi:hypothetical protein